MLWSIRRHDVSEEMRSEGRTEEQIINAPAIRFVHYLSCKAEPAASIDKHRRRRNKALVREHLERVRDFESKFFLAPRNAKSRIERGYAPPPYSPPSEADSEAVSEAAWWSTDQEQLTGLLMDLNAAWKKALFRLVPGIEDTLYEVLYGEGEES